APQRIPAEPCAHLVQRGVYARRSGVGRATRRAWRGPFPSAVSGVLGTSLRKSWRPARALAARGGLPVEQAELRGGAQVGQDHPQQPKFRTRVLFEPARKQLPSDIAQRPLLMGGRCNRPLACEGREIVTSD